MWRPCQNVSKVWWPCQSVPKYFVTAAPKRTKIWWTNQNEPKRTKSYQTISRFGTRHHIGSWENSHQTKSSKTSELQLSWWFTQTKWCRTQNCWKKTAISFPEIGKWGRLGRWTRRTHRWTRVSSESILLRRIRWASEFAKRYWCWSKPTYERDLGANSTAKDTW